MANVLYVYLNAFNVIVTTNNHVKFVNLNQKQKGSSMLKEKYELHTINMIN